MPQVKAQSGLSRRAGQTPIIKLVGDQCNLRCRYCFLSEHDQSRRQLMAPELLERLIREYLALFHGRLRFIWHGGEPLLAGLDYFERIIALQQRYRTPRHERIQNQLQTNGTLISDDWAKLFKRYRMLVGVSLDGARASHDRHRLTANGRGSFTEVLAGIETLKRHGVPFGVIQVVTKSTLDSLEQDFRFLLDELGLTRWSINPFYAPEGPHSAEHVDDKALAGYLRGVAELWLSADRPELRIREIANLVAGAAGRRPRLCAFNGTCASYFCVEYDGRVYPCDRFAGIDDYLLGDLSTQSLKDVLSGEPRRLYAERVHTLPEDCTECRWRSVCHNGCTHHRAGGPSGKYYYCGSRRAMFSFLEGKVADYEQRQTAGL